MNDLMEYSLMYYLFNDYLDRRKNDVWSKWLANCNWFADELNRLWFA